MVDVGLQDHESLEAEKLFLHFRLFSFLSISLTVSLTPLRHGISTTVRLNLSASLRKSQFCNNQGISLFPFSHLNPPLPPLLSRQAIIHLFLLYHP